MSKVCLGKTLAPILVFGPLVQVPLAFFLKSPHLILAARAVSALVTIVCWSVCWALAALMELVHTKQSTTPKSSLRKSVIDSVRLRSAHLASVLTAHGGGKRRAVRRAVSDVQSGNI